MFKSYKDLQKMLKQCDFQNHINELAKNYKNKRIVLFGAGLLADVIFDNYDLSGLNIIGIADSKYIYEKEDYRNYKTISPEEIEELNPDRILISVYNDIPIIKFFKTYYKGLMKFPMQPILKKNILSKIKIALFGN